jgi:predicted NAD/FAD-binding protein
MESHYQTEAEIESVVQGLESCTTGKDDFPHRRHLAVAVWYLRNATVAQAFEKMRSSLLRFLDHHGLGREIYKEELTRAWINLVREELETLDPNLSLVTLTNTVVERLGDLDAVVQRYPDNHALQPERKIIGK